MTAQQEGILDGMENANGNSYGIPVRKFNLLRRLKSLFWSKTGPAGDGELRPTAYLDGLRGFAAFLVYWHHHQLWVYASQPNGENAILENSWGWKGEFHLATFYGLRLFFTGGHIAVACFYVISGYVLSLKPLSLIYNRETVKLSDNLSSALFRRWFRLFIPLIVTTLAYITSWHLFGFWNTSSPPESTYGDELWKWYTEFKNFSFVFKDGALWISANPHLWSIPLEMRGSIVIWTVCLALARATTRARLLCEFLLIIYFLYIVDGYYCALFMCGMLQCDLDMLARKQDPAFPAFLRRLEPFKVFIYYHLLGFAIFLSGVPAHKNDLDMVRENPGWYYLSYLKPQAVFDFKWFWLFWAANFYVSAAARINWFKGFLETRFCQYLGRISFALYLVHGPILASIGDRVYTATGWVRHFPEDEKHMKAWQNILPLPQFGPLGLQFNFLVPNLILLPFTLWMADLVTRYVDEPSLNFSHWLYKRILGEAPAPKPEEAATNLMRLA